MNVNLPRQVGNTPLHVTQFGLGGTTLGNIYSAVEEQAALDTIDAAYQTGVRYFDTAPLYGYGLSELRLMAGKTGPKAICSASSFLREAGLK